MRGSDWFIRARRIHTHNLSVGGSGVSMYFPASGSDEATITVSGLPNTVGQGRLEIKAYVTATDTQNQGEVIWGDSSTRSSWEYMFITDQTPAGLQAVPWTETLALTCAWADGKSGQTEVVGWCTYGLFWGQIFAYNLGTTGVPPAWINENSEEDIGDDKFKLKLFYMQTGYRDGNCVDISCFLKICSSSQGHVGANTRLFYLESGIPQHFLTNLVCPVGTNATLDQYYWQVGFSMHQQLWFSSSVHDAALAFKKDLSGYPYKEPAIWWSMPGYWQVFSSGPPAVAFGLVYRLLSDEDTQYTMLNQYCQSVGTAYTPDPANGPAQLGSPTALSYTLGGIE